MSVPLSRQLDRAAYYLAIWREWMKSGAHDLGYPDRSAILAGAGPNFDDCCDTEDHKAALAVDAIIEGMEPYQQLAIHHFNLSAVWRFRRIRAENAYAEALEILDAGLRARGFP